MASIKVSFIFVNRNNTQIILNALKSLYKAGSKYKFEVFVVDNNSEEDTANSIKKALPKVNVISLKKNIGTAAFDAAIPKCKGQYLYLTPGDVRFEKKFLDVLVDFLEKNKDAAQASPKLVNYSDKSKIDMGGTWLSRAFYSGAFRDSTLGNKTIEIPYMGTGLVKRDIIKKFGYLYDKDYFFYGEDVDLGVRFMLSGYKVFYIPSSTVYHMGSISRDKSNASHLTFLMERNLLTTFFKTLEFRNVLVLLPYALLLRLMVFFRDLAKLKFWEAFARIRAIFWVVFNIGKITGKRRIIQKMRKIPDRELFKAFSEKYLLKSY